ncbi:hypothetical protein OIE62_04255 [Streptomyces scopuliridis]|uniref:Uncharacterized protein n=1 Tax=Streptomyces scopuliridis TaxID=452529 RepID=A0ACD4ZWF5_9ACTN|nr:DUF6777 domain-containing protein [Streptomyces scopuliridis]WSC02157.1 hypothetical protein OG835_37575 [Streptomyces scopuliridis]WSC04306.1 hypothetical protein OIE62_04255 [Streptomyces scopuliridis]
MRSPHRRRYVTLAVLSAGILITAGCGGDEGGEDVASAEELLLQPAADPGPDPFTRSTVSPDSLMSPAVRPPSPDARGGASGTVRTPRALPGSTPGLYGGTSAASCEVERQTRLLTQDRTKARAFAEGAGVTQASVPDFLRGLTPVVLRPDIRVTSHGYREGAAAAFQSVLQAGTAVMVDNRGVPRVRCADGSPLSPPIAAKGSVRYRGAQWKGYQPERVVVINRSPEVITSLIIVDLAANTWVERQIGTEGRRDKPPQVPPRYGPEADITDPEAVRPPGPGMPEAPAGVGPASGDAPRDRSTPGRGRAVPDQRRDAPLVPDDGVLPPDGPVEPEPGGGDLALSDEDILTGPDDPAALPGDELSAPSPDGGGSGDELIGPDAFAG